MAYMYLRSPSPDPFVEHVGAVSSLQKEAQMYLSRDWFRLRLLVVPNAYVGLGCGDIGIVVVVIVLIWCQGFRLWNPVGPEALTGEWFVAKQQWSYKIKCGLKTLECVWSIASLLKRKKIIYIKVNKPVSYTWHSPCCFQNSETTCCQLWGWVWCPLATTRSLLSWAWCHHTLIFF